MGDTRDCEIWPTFCIRSRTGGTRPDTIAQTRHHEKQGHDSFKPGCTYSQLFFSLYHCGANDRRKSGNHGANTTSITSNASATPAPATAPSSNRNGPPNPPPAHITANKSPKPNGSACSPAVSAASSLWTLHGWPRTTGRLLPAVVAQE